MPKLVFREVGNFKDWMERQDRQKYEVYISERAIILMPTVSTPPVIYGILVFSDLDKQTIKTVITDVKQKNFRNYYQVDRVQWKIQSRIKESFL